MQREREKEGERRGLEGGRLWGIVPAGCSNIIRGDAEMRACELKEFQIKAVLREKRERVGDGEERGVQQRERFLEEINTKGKGQLSCRSLSRRRVGPR